jgi:hypothetical protein
MPSVTGRVEDQRVAVGLVKDELCHSDPIGDGQGGTEGCELRNTGWGARVAGTTERS